MDLYWALGHFSVGRALSLFHQRAVIQRKRVTNGHVVSKLQIEKSCLIQRNVRKFQCARKYKIKRQNAINIQSWYRSLTCRRIFLRFVSSCTVLQSAFRRRRTLRQSQRLNMLIIRIQSIWRGVVVYRQYISQLTCVIRVQSHWRRHCCGSKYRKLIKGLKSLVFIQSLFRAVSTKRKFLKSVAAVVIIQCHIRMTIVRRSYWRIMSRIVSLQKLARRFVIKRLTQRMIINMLRHRQMKSIMDGYVTELTECVKCAVNNVGDLVKCLGLKTQVAVFLQKTFRMRIVQKQFQTTIRAIIRLQRYLRCCLANTYLAFSISYLCDLCSHGSASEMEKLLSFHSPSASAKYAQFSCHDIRQYLSIRNRTLNFTTPLHIALCSGNMAVVEVLLPGPADILAVDKYGNNASHFAVLHPSVETFMFLADCLELKYDVELLRKSGILMGLLQSSSLRAKALESTSQMDDHNVDSDDIVHKHGWLQKKGSSGRWKKVWVVLTSSHFSYFRKPSDTTSRYKVSLRECTVSRQHPIDFVFTVRQVQGDKDDGREIVLLAASEKEVRSWLLSLNALVSMGQGALSEFAKKRAAENTPVKYVNMALRKAWLNEKNAMGETPLLALARFKNKRKDGSLRVPSARIVELALWLIQNGCDINSQNRNLQTALHVSIRYGNIDMACCLVAKGCDLSIKNCDGYTALDLCSSDIKTILINSASAFGYSDVFGVSRDIVSRLKYCSYLTVNFNKHSQIATKHRDSFDALAFPFLSVSLLNSHRDLLESSQNMSTPIVRRSSYVWWGCSWDMQTPLEFLDEDCFILIELRNASSLSTIRCLPTPESSIVDEVPGCSGSGCVSYSFKSPFSRNKKQPLSDKKTNDATQCIAWQIVPIKLSRINSESSTLEMQRYPIKFPPLPGQPGERHQHSPVRHTHSATHGTNSSFSDGSFLEVSVEITKSCSGGDGVSGGGTGVCEVDLNDYKLQPQWVHQHRPLPVDNVRVGSVVLTGAPKTMIAESVAVVNISKLMGI